MSRDSTVHGLPNPYLFAILPDPDGALWLANLIGVARLDGHRFESVAEADLPKHAWSIQRDRTGTLWVGAEKGLFRLEGGWYHRIPLPG